MAEEKLRNQAPNRAGESEELDRHALETVLGTIQGVSNARGHLELVWTVIDRIWRGEPISRFFAGENATSVQEAFKQERAATPRMLLALWPDENWFRLLPEREGAVEPVAAKKLMLEQFRDGHMDARAPRLVQMCAKYGTCVAKVPWVSDTLEVTVNEPKEEEVFEEGEVSGTKTVIVQEQQKLNRDRTELVPLALEDFYIDWRYATIQEAPWVADKFRQPKEDIRLKVANGAYKNITEQQIEELGKGTAKQQQASDLVKDLKQQASGANMLIPRAEDEIQGKDWWGLFDLDGDGKRVWCNLTVVDDRHVVRITRNNLWHGQKPYVSAPWIPVENEFYGIGVIEPIVHMALDVNDMQNAINAAAALAVNPMLKVGDAANIPDNQLIVAPGRILRCENVAEVQPLLLPDTTNIARGAKEDLRRDIEEAGLPRLLLGGEAEKGETATAFSGRRQQGNLKLREPILAMHRQVQAPFLNMCLFNNQQFLKEERTVHFEGRAGQFYRYQVTPKELASVARVKPILPPQIELLGLRGQRMIAFLGTLAQLKGLAQQEPYREVLKTAFINEFGREEADLIWPEADMNWNDSQEEENFLMQKGVIVDVKPTDNHTVHIQALNQAMASDAFARKPANIKAIFYAHRANHALWFRREDEARPEGPGMDEMATAAMEGEGTKVPAANALEGVQTGQQLGEEMRMLEQGG